MKRLSNVKDCGLAARIALLVSAGAASCVLALPVAFLCSGWAGIGAAAAAAVVCLGGAVAALTVSHCLRGPQYALPAMLLAMGPRMGVPLAVALACHLHGGALADAGLVYYLLAFYPITLLVETVLSLPRAPRIQGRSKAL